MARISSASTRARASARDRDSARASASDRDNARASASARHRALPCHHISQSFDLPSATTSLQYHITTSVSHLTCPLPPHHYVPTTHSTSLAPALVLALALALVLVLALALTVALALGS